MFTQQQNILGQMGITTWHAQLDLPGAKSSPRYQSYRLNQEQSYLIVQEGQFLSADEELLMNNMLRAIGIQIESIDDQQGWRRAGNALVMLLNDEFLQEIPLETAKVFCVAHPKTLLAGGEKREAWLKLISFQNP